MSEVNEERKPKVLIAVLNLGWVETKLAINLFPIMQDKRCHTELIFPQLKGCETAHNIVCRDFLASEKGYEYLIILGDDTAPPTNYLDLVLLDKPVIGGMCFQWRGDCVYHLFMRAAREGETEGPYYTKAIIGNEGLIECDAIGSAGMVIRRDVLEAVRAPFERQYDEDGVQTLGLDLLFCKKAKAAGFTVWGHTHYPLDHVQDISLVRVNNYVVKAQRGELETDIRQDQEIVNA